MRLALPSLFHLLASNCLLNICLAFNFKIFNVIRDIVSALQKFIAWKEIPVLGVTMRKVNASDKG